MKTVENTDEEPYEADPPDAGDIQRGYSCD
jgi:hypothetical protein